MLIVAGAVLLGFPPSSTASSASGSGSPRTTRCNEIDFTTEFTGIEALKKSSSGDGAYGIRVVIGGSSSDWYGSGAGGVAFVGSFHLGSDLHCWVLPKAQGCDTAEKNIAEAATHEAGHTLGLLHDGIMGGTAPEGST